MFDWLKRLIRREPRLLRSWGSMGMGEKPFKPIEFYTTPGTYEYHIRSGNSLPPMRPLDFRDKKQEGS